LDRDFVDLDGAAEYLMLSTRTVREMASKGLIPVYGIGPNGGRLRFKVAELRDYVESCRRQPAAGVSPREYRMSSLGRPDGKPITHL
jgi:excisionase family DNA binding protein